MHRIADGFVPVEAVSKHIDGRFLHTIGQAEFFEVQWIHAQLLFKSYRVRSHLLILHAQQRARFHIVKTTVLHQELDGGTRRWALLDFIQQNQCMPWLQLGLQIRSEVGDNGIRTQRSVEHRCGSGIFQKIQLGKTPVVMFSELTNQRRLTDLPGTGNHQRFPRIGPLPVLQTFPRLAFQHHSTSQNSTTVTESVSTSISTATFSVTFYMVFGWLSVTFYTVFRWHTATFYKNGYR